MLKKASLYKLADVAQLEDLEDTLDQAKFLPCGDALKSAGWAPVRDDELYLKSHGHILLKFLTEKKVIPPSALKRAVEARCAELEETQGFPPGKKARAEIKERVADELAARALTTQTATWVWIDTARGRLVIDSSVVGTMDAILTALIRASGIELTSHKTWAGSFMNHWLLDEDTLPYNYSIDDTIQLEYPGESGSIAAFKRADLSEAKVRIHAEQGAIVTKMAMTFKDRVSFTLQPNHQLLNIKLLDVVKENQVAKDADEFENTFILEALELRALIDDLTTESA